MKRFDERCDSRLEPLRRNAFTQRVFAFASTVGDFSIVWHACGIILAVTSGGRADEAIALSAALGCESLIVNQGIKRVFRRERPTVSGDERFDIRTPRTSSFPSGHASSATFAALVLTSFTGFPLAALWISIALLVTLSRVVVRIHHASDIVGGVVTGAVLGAVALPIIGAVLG